MHICESSCAKSRGKDYRGLEKCEMVRWIVLLYVLDKWTSARMVPTERSLQPWVLFPTVKGSCGSVMLWGESSWNCLGAVIPEESKFNANRFLIVLSKHLHHMLQHFFPAEWGVFKDDNVPIHRACVVTQWFDEHDTDVIHMSWPSQSSYLNPIKHLWDILKRRLTQRFLLPSNRCELMTFSWKNGAASLLQNSRRWWTLSQHLQAGLATRGGPTPY